MKTTTTITTVYLFIHSKEAEVLWSSYPPVIFLYNFFFLKLTALCKAFSLQGNEKRWDSVSSLFYPFSFVQSVMVTYTTFCTKYSKVTMTLELKIISCNHTFVCWHRRLVLRYPDWIMKLCLFNMTLNNIFQVDMSWCHTVPHSSSSS